MVPWEAAVSLVALQNVASYSIEHQSVHRFPMQPINGVWHEVHIDNGALEEPETLKPEILDPGDKLRRVKEIVERLQSKCNEITSEAVKTSLFADSNRILASILAN